MRDQRIGPPVTTDPHRRLTHTQRSVMLAALAAGSIVVWALRAALWPIL